jgi:hypothetical protein
MEEYTKRPTDFTREILEYGPHSYCQVKETELLKEVDAARNTCYYNQQNGDGNFYYIGPLSEETKKKMSAVKLGKKRPPRSKEWSDKIGLANTGKIRTDKFKQQMSDRLSGRVSNRKGCKITAEHKEKLHAGHRGKPPWNKGLNYTVNDLKVI